MDFEEWFLKHGVPVDTDFNVAKRAYEAGQQSKQAEIDALRKRIDKAVDYADGTHSENWQETINTMLHILKGGMK